MSSSGWIMMLVSTISVTGITAYFVWRVLTAPQPTDDED